MSSLCDQVAGFNWGMILRSVVDREGTNTCRVLQVCDETESQAEGVRAGDVVVGLNDAPFDGDAFGEMTYRRIATRLVLQRADERISVTLPGYASAAESDAAAVKRITLLTENLNTLEDDMGEGE